ncbi:gamma-tubulin complex component 2 homolog [Sitodiplosis mosellana]|uniref:gamma-tubulin complex component 2 homolog n=1 Tax=Sitodiplosis mosellana TaxID=263140 RepID=UPI0024453356|nr:gamma-tubulin complex component 2 homolog [Sitodiplosis mosellana]XP_055309977.1 gamma-tubulin complex component 2 homolog [Sitodiplosis mosellana]
MSDAFDQQLRDLLRKIIRRSGQKVSSGAIIREFQKESVHPSILRQFNELIKHDSLALKLFESDSDISSKNLQNTIPEQWLKNFLEKYLAKLTLYKEIQQAAKKKNDTSIATEDEINNSKISDILKKVKAATDVYQKQQQKQKQDHFDCSNFEQIPFNTTRPHSLLYFNKTTHNSLPVGLKYSINCLALPISRQEQLVIDDIIYCIIGIPGDYIVPEFTADHENDFTPISFKISDQIDVSLRNIVQDILPMASHFSIVQKFTQWSSKAHNQILQALSEILQSILNDYRISITQLEKEHTKNILNLHKLLYLVRPNMQTLSILAELIEKIMRSDLQGGSILSLLFDEITLQTGDQMSQRMLIELTERASVPYIEMLERWLLKGVIIDPYNQFFVTDNVHLIRMENYDTARYWECQYTIKSERIPRFLENDADIILRTGKYLNVIRQCGQPISPPAGNGKLEFSAMTHKHSIFIKQAYHNASRTLLDLFMHENNLMGHITSVKKYFLLQQGDLITQFMEASEEELNKNLDKVTPVRLDNLLQLIVRLSSAKNDPCIEHLHCDLFTMDLMKQMSKIHEIGNSDGASETKNNLDLTGLECFAFKYSVHWPLSIVLNQWVLSQYQMLFRLLFWLKGVDRQLCQVWIQNIEISKNNKKIEKEQKTQWRTAFALRQRMLNAIQHLQYYMMIEVIEPNWHIFTARMNHVLTIDDVITIHQDFLHICMQHCMLHYPDLLLTLMNICGICLRFCKMVRNETTTNIEGIEKEFNDLLVSFIKTLGEQSSDTTSAKFLSLVCRLNFNSFYTN